MRTSTHLQNDSGCEVLASAWLQVVFKVACSLSFLISLIAVVHPAEFHSSERPANCKKLSIFTETVDTSMGVCMMEEWLGAGLCMVEEWSRAGVCLVDEQSRAGVWRSVPVTMRYDNLGTLRHEGRGGWRD